MVLGDGEQAPAVLALDEPTRGMDRTAKHELAGRLRAGAAEGMAVIVATHDAEFAAALAARAVLMADGRTIADGPIEEILAGGWYFATETARILGGAGGALLPDQGAELLRAARARARGPHGRASGGGPMSWQLTSFAIVLAALAAAFWWYERSEPPAKLLAVVATLAALAALGRDAFAAVPDVKPITAIVLVGGIAFGARPGFAIGAISALASNILLGEGPWTPWQMLGWGLVGLLGAGLGRLLGPRRPPPLALALVCALSAEVFNLVLDLFTWTGTGNHSLAGFGLVLGSAAVFDATHVAASFAFGLAFGPGLLRMLTRVRARLAVSWEQPPPVAAARRLPGATLLVDEKTDCSFYSLLYLAQALGEKDMSDIDIAVISDRVHSVTGEPVWGPVPATLLGPTRVIPKEFPGIACRNIDVDLDSEGTPQLAVRESSRNTCSPFSQFRCRHPPG